MANPSMSDPFDLLSLEPTFHLDLNLLEQAYFEAQRRSHPDQFSQSSPEVRTLAAQRSTAINHAYLVLKNPLKRAGFLLEKEGVGPLISDPDFLLQMMEWREAIAEGQDLSQDLQEQEILLFQGLEAAFRGKNYELANRYLYRLTYTLHLSSSGDARHRVSPSVT